MSKDKAGFSLVEIMVVITMIMIMLAIALPQAFQAVKGARLHSDASGLTGQLSIIRLRATSQFSPFRIVIQPGTTPPSYYGEQLCAGNTTNPGCAVSLPPCTQPYNSFSPIQYSTLVGTQFLSTGVSFLTTNPFPANPGGITTTVGSTAFMFNTRGMPVKCDGSPLANGGAAIYLQNQDGLTDGVVVTVGGQVNVYQWNPTGNNWLQR